MDLEKAKIIDANTLEVPDMKTFNKSFLIADREELLKKVAEIDLILEKFK